MLTCCANTDICITNTVTIIHISRTDHYYKKSTTPAALCRNERLNQNYNKYGISPKSIKASPSKSIDSAFGIKSLGSPMPCMSMSYWLCAFALFRFYALVVNRKMRFSTRAYTITTPLHHSPVMCVDTHASTNPSPWLRDSSFKE